MSVLKNDSFNSNLPCYMHLDLNSCFATIEQQANPLLRGKPIAIAAYTTLKGCILAPSIEAKKFGVKVGMRVIDGKKICPNLIILAPDPPKYRFVNQALFNLLSKYTPYITIKSIDEMLVNFSCFSKKDSLQTIAGEIKQKIKSQIGEWITASIGISTNQYLAKLAAGLKKPDGLVEINQFNILKILFHLTLTDLPYIKQANAWRLLKVGIKNPTDFYFASLQNLKAAFESINGYYWFLKLHGYEIDNPINDKKTIGHSYALPKPTNNINELLNLICKLVEKTGKKMRINNFTTQGIHLALYFSDRTFWHHGQKLFQPIYTNQDMFRAFDKMLVSISNLKPVSNIFITCFNLKKDLYSQLNFFNDEDKKRSLTQALDQINNKWGDFSIYPARIINIKDKIVDRIAFGKTWDDKPLNINPQSEFSREIYIS